MHTHLHPASADIAREQVPVLIAHIHRYEEEIHHRVPNLCEQTLHLALSPVRQPAAPVTLG